MDPSKHHNALDPRARLHWYEIKSILGQGGFGITYLAFDTNLKQQVAIKEYLPVEFSTRDASHTVQPISHNHDEIYRWGLQRFLQEAQTLAQFKHPNIVRVRTFFEHNNTGYIVMDYEQGVELEKLIEKGAHFNEQRLLEILLPILDGLAQIHRAGIIHRDIKPANIYIRSDQSPVLLDFGSARYAISNQTKTMTSLVTPGYAPFEQYHQAEGKQGPWTDIYALGATCYCAITGKPPPDALKRGMVQFEHNLDVYLELADIKAGKYSQHLLQAIDCALRFREKDRPQTVTAWRQMLTGQSPVPDAGAKTGNTSGAETAPAEQPAVKDSPEPARDRAGSSIWSLPKRLILLGLFAVAGWYVYDHQQEIKGWVDAYIGDIASRKIATQETQQEERLAELARQEASPKNLEEEVGLSAPEQEETAPQELEQRKQELQAELARLDRESEEMSTPSQPDLSGQPQPVESEQSPPAQGEPPQLADGDQLQQEQARLAELAREEAEQRRLDELARQQAARERELEQERQRLEREKERLAALKKQAEEEAQRLAEEQRQAELARQREELIHEAELAEQRAAQARLEAEKRKQAELAREIAAQQEMADLSTEAAIEQLRAELGRRSRPAKLVVDETLLAEIVREQMEKLRAQETARLKAENLAVAQRLLKSAEEYFGRKRLEEALTDYRNAHDLNASPETREAALQGIIDTMAQLYAGGNSETWQLLKGDQSRNLSGEYVGHYQARDEAGEENKSLAVSTMVAHKGNQLTLAAMDLGIVVIGNIENGKGELSFYDTKNDIYGTGTLIADSSDFAMGIEWSSADGSVSGRWRAQNQHTLWHIDLNGEYVAEVTNIHVSVFRKKTFNFRLTDLTTPAHAGNPNEISGISEDGNIKLSGRKIGVSRIRFEFVSDAFNIRGNGQFDVSGAHGDSLTGTWEIPDFDYEQSSGDWTLRRLP